MPSAVENKNCIAPAVLHFGGEPPVNSSDVTSPQPAVSNAEKIGVTTPSGVPASNAEQAHGIPDESLSIWMIAALEVTRDEPAVDVAQEDSGHAAAELPVGVVADPSADVAVESRVDLVSDAVVEVTRRPTPTSARFLFPPPTGPAATSPVRRRPEHFANIPCRFFARGYCSRGAECWYKHASIDVDSVEGHRENPVAAEEGETCAICLEAPKQYGLMTGCDHVFCLTCIRSWRACAIGPNSSDSDLDEAGETMASACKTCPLCRQRTRYVIPSAVFPSKTDGGVHKAQIEAVYLRRIAEIPCKHFVASLEDMRRAMALADGHRPRNMRGPMCPFGNDCHYKHEMTAGQRYVFTDSELSRHRRIYASDRRRRYFNRWNAVNARLGLLGPAGYHEAFGGSTNELNDHDNVIRFHEIDDDYDSGDDWYDNENHDEGDDGASYYAFSEDEH